MRGLNLWLDSQGGKGKTFGIKYPVGLMRSGMATRDMVMNREGGQDNLSPERWLTMLVTSTAELELLGPDKNEVRPMVPANLTGIDLKVGLNNGTFVYELKIPLNVDDSHPYGIGMGNGGPIGFGCEIPQFRFSQPLHAKCIDVRDSV